MGESRNNVKTCSGVEKVWTGGNGTERERAKPMMPQKNAKNVKKKSGISTTETRGPREGWGQTGRENRGFWSAVALHRFPLANDRKPKAPTSQARPGALVTRSAQLQKRQRAGALRDAVARLECHRPAAGCRWP